MKTEREIVKTSKNLPDLLNELELIGANNTSKMRCIEEFLRIRAWENGIPRYGKFELTPFCNLDCKMCYIHLQKEQMQNKKLLDVFQWKKLMREAVDAGMGIATLTGGECLTYPGFEELYLYLHSLGVEIIIMTNGILLNQKKICFLKEHPPKMIQISLYGNSEEAYKNVTGHYRYQIVMENINMVRAARLPLKIAVTPSVYMKDAEDMIRFLAKENLSYEISAGLFEPYEDTGRKGKAIETSKDNYLRLYHLQAKLKGRTLTPLSEDCLPLPDKEKDGGRGLLCGGGNNAFVINYQGALYPCSMLQEYGTQPLEMGFQKAWNDIHRFVQEYLRPVECEGCRLKGVCPGCVVEHGKGASKGHANPDVCDWGRQLVREGFVAVDII